MARTLFALILVGSVLCITGVASAAQLTLDWVDNAGGTAIFSVERKTGTVGTYAQIGTTPAGVTTYVDATVAAGTTYCYRVRASNAAGNSDYSNEACGTPGAGFDVIVATTGSGSGSVVSAPAGITCPGTCVQSYAAGTVLTLTPNPATGSSFGGWSGGGCAGTAPCVLTGNAPVTVTATFAANNTAPTPSITSLNPSSVMAGSAAFAISVTGSGFVSGATATVGGQARTVAFVSSNQLTIAVSAADIATQGSVGVQVSNPAPCAGGACASNSIALNVTAPTPAPTLSGISPTAVIAGGPAFTLTATGTDFTATSVVRVNGVTRTTSFVSATQLTASIPASGIAAPGTSSITVFTPVPGGGTSGGQTLTVLGPSLTVNATSVVPGGSVTATLTNSPGGSTDWLALALVGAPATSYLQYVYVPALPGTAAKTWSIPMPATLGQYEFRLYLNNTYVIAATSSPVTVASISPTPTIASLAPAGVAAGSAGFTLTVTGTGFVAGATATVGGQPRSVTIGSATQLSIAVLGADVTGQGNVPVQITNPAACVGDLCASNAVNLVVTPPPPAPTLGGISPATVAAGGPAFTLTASGANFAANSIVLVNNVPRATLFGGASQLTATILAADIATTGTPTITVFTPAPGGGTSAGQLLTVTGPALSVSGTNVPPSASVTATLTNTPGGSTDWLALALAGAPATSYLQYVYVSTLPGTTAKTWSIPMPASLGQYEFRLYLNNSYVVAATSPPVTVASISPTPSITTLSPAGVGAGSAGFALAVFGSGFVAGATATVGGQPRTVTVTSATELTIAVLAADVTSPGTVPVQVTNPAACVGGLCVSNSVTLVVTPPPPAPTLSGISPSTVAAGGPALALTASGANFAANSIVLINGAPRATVFNSPTQLTATILATDITTTSTPTITVFTPAPGGGTSGGQILTVMGPTLTVNTTSAAPGGVVTSTLTNAPGGGTDWLALAPVGAPDTSYLQYVYVGAGVTTRTWTVTMPATPGLYEFRFLPNNGYVRAATSPAVTVGN